MSDYNDDEYRRDRESRDRRRADRSDRDRYHRDSRKDRDYSSRDRSYDRHDDRHLDRTSDSGQYDDYNGDDGYRRSPRRDDDNRYGYRRDDLGRDDRASQKWMADTPSHTVLLRGLPPSIDEITLRTELQSMSVLPKDVRLVKRKDTGQSRGFAFVEFHSVLEAQTWMENVRGHITLLDKYTIQMYYSSPKSGGGGAMDSRVQDWNKTDWTCLKCGTHNFKRRDHCFKCNMSREDSETVKDGDGLEHVGHNPCNTLIFRGLDALTTEDSILTGLMRVTALPTKNVKVMKDSLTNTSKGYAFVEMPSLQESQQLLDTIHNLLYPFDIDGKAVVVSYAKNTYSTIMATNLIQQQAQWATGSSYYQTQQATDTGSYNYATFYSQQQAAVAPQSDTANAAAALALAAIQQAQAAKHYKQDGRQVTQSTPAVVTSSPVTASVTATNPPVAMETGKYPIPDVSTYTYDATSGYYFDASTGFYYEANTQYYYNPQTQQFLYWDSAQQTYLPAPTQGQGQDAQSTPGGAAGQQQAAGGENKEVKEKDKKQKGQVAKKIAKDMEKWAKSQNAQKEMMKKVMSQTTPVAVAAATSAVMTTAAAPAGVSLTMAREFATADAGFAVLEKSDRSNLQRMADSGAGALVSYGSDSEGEGDAGDDEPTTVQAIEERLTDWTKLACLLCKRQFPVRETLVKHQQMSDLHKTNLNDYVKSKGINLLPSTGTTPSGDQQPLLYRDRAKERRQKYGAPPPPQLGGGGGAKKTQATPPVKRQQQRGDDDYYYDAPPPVVIAEKPKAPGLDNSNIGNKLMQKMGWNQGQGLGRENQGMSAPIEARPRQSLSGLGADGANTYYVRQPGESYVSAVKNTMLARFKEMD